MFASLQPYVKDTECNRLHLDYFLANHLRTLNKMKYCLSDLTYYV